MKNENLVQEINELHADICSALADPTRILILYTLAEKRLSVTELATVLGISQPAASRHLKVLRERGLVRTERLGNRIVLSVVDNGCGMSPAFLNESLFRPFQSTKKNGLGIGLFQSRMMVEAHGGKIQVESEARVGTTVRVSFPVSGSGADPSTGSGSPFRATDER